MTASGKPESGALAAFGRYLVQERELRGVAREDVARATRLPLSAIEAMEAGDTERSPHHAYLVVYLRGYATAVGLDPDEVLLRYEEVVGRVGAGGAAPAMQGGPLRAAAVVAALALAALAIWALRGR